MAKAQRRAMEMEQHEVETVVERKHAILDKVTLLEKGAKILDQE
jgi:hypothetical protein